MPPLVSVIIPVYGHARYLDDTIRSALAQTMRDWEIVAVDDSSPDNSAEVIRSFGDPRIRYIWQANQGMAGARNSGLKLAEGEYVVFLDDDDLLEPEFMQTCLEALRQDSTLAGVYVQNYYVDADGQRMPMVAGTTVPRQQFYRRLLEGGFFPPVAAFTRLAVVREVGLFDVTLEGEADRDLWLRIGQCYDMQGIARPLVSYRMHVGGRSNDMNHMFQDCLRVLNKHLGPPDGDPHMWSEDKRLAYGFAHRYAAYGFMQQGQNEVAWQHLDQAIDLYPPLLARLDTFYELACGDQRKGVRGKADLIDLSENGAQMLRWLDRLYSQPDRQVQPHRRAAYGNAYLALAMLSDQSGDWSAARQYLFNSFKANPALLMSHSPVRRMLKLLLGTHLTNKVRTAHS
jgi:glycosyltransferase involved in cell wall biosynthesis